MFFRALISFITLPVLFAVIIPAFIAYVDPWRSASWAPGMFFMFAGAVILLWCVRDFYKLGKGTLAPWDPPKKLVILGLYRFVRNPMYIGVLLLVLGWGLFFCSPLLFLYVFVLTIGFHIRVVRNEEPWLKTQFGEQWELYQKEVSRWLPRIGTRKK